MMQVAEIDSHVVPTWDAGASPAVKAHDWRAVDLALRSIMHRRGKLDAEEMHWLREADALRIWIPLGMVSAYDYMERVLGYGYRKAAERLRTARALRRLPQLTAALDNGELPFSAVRELTRVAEPETEGEWVAAVRGKNLRQVEELVTGRRPGDRPSDPQDPEVRTHVVRFELTAETFARLRQARQILDNEHGSNLSDEQLVGALCGAVLDGNVAGEPDGRARFQVAVTVCQRCQQGWQEGAGVQVPIGAAGVERAMCDAQHVGSIDGDAPERAYQDVTPAVARFVWRRDGGRCRVPGCRSARGLEIHHVIHRADGGGHEASNCILLCSRCHQSHHAGTLQISGTAARLTVRRPAGPEPHFPTAVSSSHAAEVHEVPAECGNSTVASIRSSVSERPSAHVGPCDGELLAIRAASPAPRSRASVSNLECPDESSAQRSTEVMFASSAQHGHVGAPHEDLMSVGASALPGSCGEHGAGALTCARERAADVMSVAGAHVGATNGRRSAISAASRASTHVGTPNVPDAGVLHRPSYRDGEVRAGASKLDVAVRITEAKAALRGLGWKPSVATAAVTAAASELAEDASLERLIFEALRRCPRRSSTSL